jgi:hypothetical protein
MLMISMGLALLVVVLYNVQINSIRNADSKDAVNMLQYKMAKKAGDTISERDDIQIVPVPAKMAAGFNSVKKDTDLVSTGAGVIGKKLFHAVAKGDWVTLDDFPKADTYTEQLDEGTALVSIPVDSKMSPGSVLRVSNCVNVLGEVQVSPGQFRTMTLMTGLIVRSIDGRAESDSGAAAVSSNNITKIGVIMPTKVSRQFYNLLSHVKGRQVIVEIASPRNQKMAKDVEIDKEFTDEKSPFKKFIDQADPGSGGSFTTGGPLPPPL